MPVEYGMNLAAYAGAAGVGLQVLFRQYEPSVLQYLSLNGLLVLVSVTYALILSDQPASAPLVAKTVFEITGSLNVCLALTIVAYRLSPWHPLYQYPGPVLAKCSKLWMVYWTATGKRHLMLLSLHKKYGPWLRIGPNEISVNSPPAIRPIYGKMFRSPSYQAAPQDADALISTTSREEHDHRLVAWAKAFTTDALRNYRSFAEIRTDQLIEILRKESAKGESVNLSNWISLWAMDFMGDMSFSGGFETMASGGDPEGWLDVLHMGCIFVAVFGHIPWMRDVIAILPQPGPIITFQKFAARKVEETKGKGFGAKQDILGIIQDESSGGPLLSKEQAAADASFIILAGSDTVSEGVTALFWYLARNAQIQEQLRSEINTALEGVGEIDGMSLLKLPYLDACIQETLRLAPPVPAGPSRYSGDSGDYVQDKYMPPRTTVSCPTYSLHRDPQNFVRPESFIPERWLPGFTEQPHNVEAFIPFCYGPGVCIGKPVALYNMKLVAVKVLKVFRLAVGRDFDILKFDASWKEYGIWKHDVMMVGLTQID